MTECSHIGAPKRGFSRKSSEDPRTVPENGRLRGALDDPAVPAVDGCAPRGRSRDPGSPGRSRTRKHPLAGDSCEDPPPQPGRHRRESQKGHHRMIGSRGSRIAHLAGALLLAARLGSAAVAPTTPGVGYDPQARGLSVSIYQLDTLTSPLVHYTCNFTADPGAVGAHPNPYYLDI